MSYISQIFTWKKINWASLHFRPKFLKFFIFWYEIQKDEFLLPFRKVYIFQCHIYFRLSWFFFHFPTQNGWTKIHNSCFGQYLFWYLFYRGVNEKLESFCSYSECYLNIYLCGQTLCRRNSGVNNRSIHQVLATSFGHARHSSSSTNWFPKLPFSPFSIRLRLENNWQKNQQESTSINKNQQVSTRINKN